jgi:ATP adenylyltransferase
MKVMWAPWRVDYITSNKREDGCIFCNRLAQKDDRANLILKRGKHAFVIMNRYPYSNGHLMAVPNRHVSSPAELSTEETIELMALVNECAAALSSEMKTQGMNIGMNLGKAAGAGVEDHVHFHIVPRWFGDTNFITVVGDLRVVPEHFQETYDKLLKHFQHCQE